MCGLCWFSGGLAGVVATSHRWINDFSNLGYWDKGEKTEMLIGFFPANLIVGGVSGVCAGLAAYVVSNAAIRTGHGMYRAGKALYNGTASLLSRVRSQEQLTA